MVFDSLFQKMGQNLPVYLQMYRGSWDLKVKFKFSLSPEANIIMHIHMHGDTGQKCILLGHQTRLVAARSEYCHAYTYAQQYLDWLYRRAYRYT